jgi:cytochrome c oxidase subunit III
LGIDIQEAIHSGQTPSPPSLGPRTGHSRRLGEFRPERSETGVWIGIFAIVMSFAAFTSAMIVRQGASPDWRHFELPRLLYVNTLNLLASSVTLGLARRRLASIAGLLAIAPSKAAKSYSEGMNWIYCTLAFGALFVFGQALAWRTLAKQGLFLSTNPSSSFFYVFTAMHAVHLLGGIGGLVYMIRKLSKTNRTGQTTGMRALCVYWHFMDGLWIYLFILLMART